MFLLVVVCRFDVCCVCYYCLFVCCLLFGVRCVILRFAVCCMTFVGLCVPFAVACCCCVSCVV